MLIHIKKNASNQAIELLTNFLANNEIEYQEVLVNAGKIIVIEARTNLNSDNLIVFDCVESISSNEKKYLLAARTDQKQTTVVTVKGIEFNERNFVMIAGPCSVESEKQLETIAQALVKNGIKLMRGGVFKPRSSVYSFQGLGLDGLKLFKKVADRFNLGIVSEITSVEQIDDFVRYVDLIQVGARNMQNYELLKRLGKINKPVLLKRGNSATYEELLMSAEYILSGGNNQVILCERGIRTFETYTRNTLDIQAVLALKDLTHLPIIVDPSHASGRFEMVIPLVKAALTVEANGAMIEIHPQPELALSDGNQSIKLNRFDGLIADLIELAKYFNKAIK